MYWHWYRVAGKRKTKKKITKTSLPRLVVGEGIDRISSWEGKEWSPTTHCPKGATPAHQKKKKKQNSHILTFSQSSETDSLSLPEEEEE